MSLVSDCPASNTPTIASTIPSDASDKYANADASLPVN